MRIIVDGTDTTQSPPHWMKDALKVLAGCRVDVRGLSFTKDRRGPALFPKGDVTMNTVVGHGVEVYWTNKDGERTGLTQVMVEAEVVLVEEIVIQTVLHFADLDWIEITPAPDSAKARAARAKLYRNIATNDPGLG